MASPSSAVAANIERIRATPPPRRREIPFLYSSAAWVLLIFLTTTAFAFLIWVIVHPNFPKIHISSAAMSNFTSTDTTVSADCNITLIFTNTNRHLKTIYDRMEISLIYPSQGVLLSQIYHPSFVQPKRNQTAVETNLSFVGVFLGKDVVEAMNQDMVGESLSLGVNVFAIVNYRNGKWITRSQFMRAYCGNLIFGFSVNRRAGMLSIPIGQCEVNLY